MASNAVHYCANHPDRATTLRCNNCGKYICAKCAVHMATGYRCQECVRGQRKTFETATPTDYIVGFVVASALSAVGGFLAVTIGFFTILLAPFAGGIIAEAVRAATSRRRAPNLFLIEAAGVALGGLIFIARPLLFFFASGDLRALISLLWPVVYVAMATPTAYYRISGISIGR